MKTLLVLAQTPDLSEEVRKAVNPERYRVLHRATLDEAEPFLSQGLADGCIVDVELTDVQAVWLLEKIRRRAPKCPTIVYTGAKQSQWEEEAYLQGAAQVFNKPLRGRLLNSFLERLWPAPDPYAIRTVPAQLSEQIANQPDPRPAPSSISNPAHPFGSLRDFSRILTHSLDAEAMLNQLLLFLRDILSINRAVIFLRQPVSDFGSAARPEENRRLKSVCSVGLSTGLLQHLELSIEAGIGGHLSRLGRIVRRYSDEVRNDPETQKEFELLGAQVAVPILDRESMIGVAVFDGRITGEPLVNSDLEMIFHLLEQAALAIQNIWLHDQVAANNEIMAQILRELNDACVVVNRDLVVLHANKAARKFFSRAERKSGELEFSDLPPLLGAKVYQVLRTGSGLSSFRYEPENAPGALFNVNVVPFQRQAGGLPASALLMVEDLTQSEQLRRLEVEASNLRLVRSMADRLTHEIGNALVPLSVHQQMLAEKLGRKSMDTDFLKLMERDLADSVKRVTRFTNQMRFLARDALLTQEAFPIAPLIEEAYEEARKHQPVKASQFKYEDQNQSVVLTGDRSALKHAFTEIILNALQANPADPRIGVRLHPEPAGNGLPEIQIDVQDNGTGFTTEAAEKASAPFFTTRNVGLGLGLTVTKKIIETHHGKLEIVPPKAGQNGLVRISLPIESPQSKA
jgi:signal transduction histidine kinase/CheY-like chemotaxis protein